jgi:Gly-Xaa carboxypeptidase
MINTWGQQFAVPGVAEKGHYDLGISVETLGGHSSVPRECAFRASLTSAPHTGIGLMSLLIAELEKNPHPLVLEEASPMYGFVTCAADYAEDMPKGLKSTVKKAGKGDKKAWSNLAQEIVDTGIPGQSHGPGQGDPIRALMSTTQATDIINGGVKVNALPEVVTAVINHRVNVASDHVELQDRTINTLMPVVKKYNLTLVGFGETVHTGGASKVVLSNAYGYYTDPAPISPFTIDDPAWKVMAGTARGMWASRPEVSDNGAIVELPQGEDLVLAPFFTTGNTDTRRYWDLTRSIYRFRYFDMSAGSGAHTINEWTVSQRIRCAANYRPPTISSSLLDGTLPSFSPWIRPRMWPKERGRKNSGRKREGRREKAIAGRVNTYMQHICRSLEVVLSLVLHEHDLQAPVWTPYTILDISG